MGQAPLILTLRLDRQSFARFDEERRRHFPAHLNQIPAHVSLFHHLPGEEENRIRSVLAAASKATAPFLLEVTGVRSLGFGVAYTLTSPQLLNFRRILVSELNVEFTRQDEQQFKPHVTIQNKVSAAQARETHSRLTASFTPFLVKGEGLCLWRYLGGPWELLGLFLFRLT